MFFNVVSRKDFLLHCSTFPHTPKESVPLEEATGRPLASDVVSQEHLPLTSRSCMDGYALQAKDIFGAGESNPAYLELQAEIEIDAFPEFTLKPGHCARIPTGGCLPANANAVIMIEHTHDMGGTIEIRKSVAPYENVMHRGEDAEPGQTVLTAGTRLRVQDAGLLAALGIGEVTVHQRPKLAVLSTGNEVVPVQNVPRPGQVRDVNSFSIRALARQAGAEAHFLGIVPDKADALRQAMKHALAEHDAVFLSGGSSVGTRDLTVEVLEDLPDTEILVHGVAMSPGKPTILARQGHKAILGLPGQTASAHVVMLMLGLPLLRSLEADADAATPERFPVRAELTRNIASRQGREDFIRVRLEPRPDDLPLAHPVPGRSGLMRTLLQSHGLAAIPASSEGLYQGQHVNVLTY
ncbi:molybdopterin molybdotransferase [Paucidesulfovibrio gracilis DSM 16080]|uniref:Molybdopterin molybdenumtransferase n=1 Tax=Paucidesulfovibrio gracilis DSM 16080 TaxID=1121449 RepID=A0A1T4Y1G4_9BACT|nr:gephyrin-like molybdotransferase Glp [Paucidesulfovibrio gracilis]SKA95616.1 molybdopterin molybdotransferase [Paucidesulfovibrio gracilis DSM 16080]